MHLAKYSETDLLMDYRVGYGARTWCQESSGGDRIDRGTSGVSRIFRYNPSGSSVDNGWRPVLEKVS